MFNAAATHGVIDFDSNPSRWIDTEDARLLNKRPNPITRAQATYSNAFKETDAAEVKDVCREIIEETD